MIAIIGGANQQFRNAPPRSFEDQKKPPATTPRGRVFILEYIGLRIPARSALRCAALGGDGSKDGTFGAGGWKPSDQGRQVGLSGSWKHSAQERFANCCLIWVWCRLHREMGGMRPIWIMAALAGVIAAPALAQTKIPPSHLYSSEPPAPLDKNYGMPPCPCSDVPQKATVAKPQNEFESFTGLSTVGRPETQPSDVPDFFHASPGMASSDAQTSDVPNFFRATPDRDPPKVAKAQSAYSTMDTPLFTTTNEPPLTTDTTSGETYSTMSTPLFTPARGSTQHPLTPCPATRRRRMGQGRADNGAGEGNRTLVCSLGTPNPNPWRAIRLSRRYRPARSHRLQTTARTVVCAATAPRVIDPRDTTASSFNAARGSRGHVIQPVR